METVLVVESQAITRYSWTHALLNQGYRVLDAWSASEAFDLISAYPGIVSALVLEFFFSDVSAKKLASQMKAANPKLCVIASSTHPSDHLPADLPCDAVLQKPVNPREVLAVIEKLLKKHQCSN